MSTDLDEAVKRMGFASEQEFHHLVSSIRLDSPERLARFKKWQDDGTKAALLAVRAENGLTASSLAEYDDLANRMAQILTLISEPACTGLRDKIYALAGGDLAALKGVE